MLLTIDVGNTSVSFGLFKGAKLVKMWKIKTAESLPRRRESMIENMGLDSRFRGNDIKAVIISSVVPLVDKKLIQAIKKKFGVNPIFVNYKNIPLKLNLKNKAQVGADRLVNAFAAWKLYKGPAVIVDFGTATTFCAINAKGEYLGGAIAPGISLSRDALHFKTAKLPLVSFQQAKKAVGKDTKNAMLSGLYFGYIALVEGMISRFRKEIGKNSKVVATGGFANLIGKNTRVFDIIDTKLTLNGLRLIWEEIK